MTTRSAPYRARTPACLRIDAPKPDAMTAPPRWVASWSARDSSSRLPPVTNPSRFVSTTTHTSRPRNGFLIDALVALALRLDDAAVDFQFAHAGDLGDAQ